MTSSMLATAVSLAPGLRIFALGERLRSARERRLDASHTSPTRKDIS